MEQEDTYPSNQVRQLLSLYILQNLASLAAQDNASPNDTLFEVFHNEEPSRT